MKPAYPLLLAAMVVAGCKPRDGQSPQASPPPPPSKRAAETALPTVGGGGAESDLVAARKGFQTKPVRQQAEKEPVAEPPAAVFRTVRYTSPVGQLAAYLTPDPKDGARHPAVVWITGGDCNTIGDVWSDAPRSNDQTASAYRKAGIVMMFPSLRGGNDNPGVREGFLGEVDDVLAAADFLAKQDYVDPARIYLGGHSTGGTLALLVSECSDRFRAVFSFGPAHDVSAYGPEYTPFDTKDPKEVALRSPGRWLDSVKRPTFVFEGTVRGNLASLQAMIQDSTNPNVQFFPILGANHFDILAPANEMLAAKVLRDTGATCNLNFTLDDKSELVVRRVKGK